MSEDGPERGRRLGRYVLRERLAVGGQGAVYLADDDELARTVAIKLRPAQAEPARAAAAAEAMAAATIDHPYAVHVYGSGVTDDGWAWTAMEWVRGPTLAELIARRGPLPGSEAVEIIARLAEVLAILHRDGRAHRDVTAANVMIVERSGALLPKLGDFGLAADDPTSGAGTPAYLAPEVWRGEQAGPAADVYALAVCAHLALAGALPFDGDGTSLARAHAAGPRPRLGPPVPEAIATVVERALAIAPDDRPSALAFAAALRAGAGDAGRPGIDPDLLAMALSALPEPIAEAVAGWEATSTPAAALAAIAEALEVIARWLGVCALAWARARGDDEHTGALAANLRGVVTPSTWLTLRPDRDPLGRVLGRAIAQVDAALADEPARDLDGAGLAIRTATLTVALRAIAPLAAWRVVARVGDRVERWTGVRRRRRPAVWCAAPGALPDGGAALIDDDGVLGLALPGLTAVAPPFDGAAPELFVIAGLDDDLAILRATPTGYLRRIASASVGLGSAATEPDTATAGGPYPGLEAFSVDDARWFVGRERDTEACINRLRERGLVAVLGPSGVGKSSFVAAGVIPALAATAIAIGRPGPELLPRLTRSLGGDARDLEAAARRCAAAGPVVIAIDQLEEVVTRGDADAARALGVVLARLGAIPGVLVIVTVRDDFFVRAAAALGLSERLGAGAFVLGPPERADLERIVVEPATRAGYQFDDPTLPAEMVDAAIGAAAPLPLLAFAASELWRRRDRTLRHLCRHDHDQAGGVLGALARHADAVLDAMPPSRRGLARPVFASLATADGARVPRTRGELHELHGDPDLPTLIDELITARLLTSSDGDRGAVVELVHEALLAAWPRLAGWRRDDAAAAITGDAVRVAAQQWDRRGRAAALLWRDDALAEARAWRRRYAPAMTAREREFLDGSEAGARRRRVRRRALAATVAVVAATAIVVLTRANREAREQRARARSAALAAEAAAATTSARLQAQLLEQGRGALLDGQPLAAQAWLAAAVDAGADPATFPRLAGEALARLGADGVRRELFTAPANQVAWSRDGRRVALGSRAPDASVVVLDADGQLVRRIAPGAGSVSSVSFSVDGERLAVVAGGALSLVDLTRDDPPMVLATEVRRAHFSPDGAWLASADEDGAVRLWRGDPLALHRTLAARRVPPGTSTAVEVVWRDDGRLVIGDRAGGLRLFAAATGEALAEGDAGAPVLELRAHGEVVASQPRASALVAVWRGTPGRATYLRGHSGDVEEVELDAAGAHAVTASLDGTVMRWRTDDGRLLAVHGGGGSPMVEVAIAGELDIGASADGRIRGWHDQREVLLGIHPSSTVTMALSPSGDRLAVGDLDGGVAVWKVAPSDTSSWPRAVNQIVRLGDRDLAIGPELTMLVDRPLAARPSPIGAPGSLVVQHLRTGDVHGDRAALPDRDGVVVIAPDGTPQWRCAVGAAVTAARLAGATVVAATLDGRLWRCDPSTDPGVIATHAGAVLAVAIAPGGLRVASAGADRTLQVVTLSTSDTRTLTLPRNATALAWLPAGGLAIATVNGDLFVVASNDATPRLVRLGAGQQAVAMVTVDDGHVAIGYADGRVDLVSLALGEPVRRWHIGETPLWLELLGAGSLRVSMHGAARILDLAAPATSRETLRAAACTAGFHVAGGGLRPGPGPACPAVTVRRDH